METTATQPPKKQSAAIYLCGLPMIDKPESVKTFYFYDEKELVAELKKMQEGYCNDDDKVKIEERRQTALVEVAR